MIGSCRPLVGMYTNATTSVGVQAEMHLFASGGHGYGMCDDDGNALCELTQRLVMWLQSMQAEKIMTLQFFMCQKLYFLFIA